MTSMRNPRSAALLRIALGALAVAAPAVASADDKAVCADAYHQSQVLRDEGKLVLARAQIAVCKAACPAHVSGDCEEWLGEVETKLASVVIVARDAAGNPVAAPRVVVDGRTADARGPIEVDPGAHVVRVEHAGTTVEKRVEVAVGQKGARVEVLFPGGVRVAAPPAPAPAPPWSTGGPPKATWVLGIGGLAMLGAAGVLGVHGHTRRSDLDACSPRCAPEDLDSIRTEWWVAVGLAGAGTVAVGAAAIVWASTSPAGHGGRASPPRASLSVSLAPRAGGANATLHGVF